MEVASEHGVYHVTAGLIGCDIGIVVAEFPEPQSADKFAVDFKIGKRFALMHALEWEGYVREAHKGRKFDRDTLQRLLSRGRHVVAAGRDVDG